MNRLVSELALYDVANVAGVAADLSHCNTPTQVCCVLPCLRQQPAGGAALHAQRGPARMARLHRLSCMTKGHMTDSQCEPAPHNNARRPQVKGYTGADELAGALKGAELVVIPAGAPDPLCMPSVECFQCARACWRWHAPLRPARAAACGGMLCTCCACSCPDSQQPGRRRNDR